MLHSHSVRHFDSLPSRHPPSHFTSDQQTFVKFVRLFFYREQSDMLFCVSMLAPDYLWNQAVNVCAPGAWWDCRSDPHKLGQTVCYRSTPQHLVKHFRLHSMWTQSWQPSNTRWVGVFWALSLGNNLNSGASRYSARLYLPKADSMLPGPLTPLPSNSSALQATAG